MRSYYKVMIFVVLLGVISGGCKLKERQYGKFTEEELANLGYPTIEGLPAVSGGITVSVMGEAITVDEVVNSERVIEALTPLADLGVYNLFRKNAKATVEQIVVGKVSDVLIYHLAKKNAQSNIDEVLDKAVETEISKHVANYENNYALAEKAFKNMGFTDWKSFRQYKRKFVMTQFYMSSKVKKDKPIAHSDMIARYNSLKDQYQWDGVLKMRVIDIHPDKLDPSEIDTANSETKEQAALRKGKELLELIKTGKDFGGLAQTHSDGIGNKTGGLWGETTPGILKPPYDVVDKAAEKMNGGDVSDLIVTDGHVFIMKLEEKLEGGYTPFVEVQGRMEAELKILQQRVEYNKIFAEVVAQADIRDLDIFVEYCLRRAFVLISETN
jgi:parvulin-like peptidyl-prolyl isomerase